VTNSAHRESAHQRHDRAQPEARNAASPDGVGPRDSPVRPCAAASDFLQIVTLVDIGLSNTEFSCVLTQCLAIANCKFSGG
jgi:hypothetical protein